MKRVLGMGNALIDVLVQAESDALLRELQLPKGSMQLIGPARYRELQQRFASLSPRRTTGGSACNTLLALAHLCLGDVYKRQSGSRPWPDSQGGR